MNNHTDEPRREREKDVERGEEKNKQDVKKERRMPMKPGFVNISSMPLTECFSLLCFHHSVDVLLLFSSVHSSIHNSNWESTRHPFPVCLYLLPSFFVISCICT